MATCTGFSASIIVGFGFGMCPYIPENHPLPYVVGGYFTYSVGGQAGASYDVNDTIYLGKDINLGWDWLRAYP